MMVFLGTCWPKQAGRAELFEVLGRPDYKAKTEGADFQCMVPDGRGLCLVALSHPQFLAYLKAQFVDLLHAGDGRLFTQPCFCHLDFCGLILRADV